jgi:hypothetical protein
LGYAIITSGLVVAGAVALYRPATLDAHDRWGFAIACGTGFSADYAQAEAADHDAVPSGYPQTPSIGGRGHVAQCQSMIMRRRVWAASLAVIGAVGLIALKFQSRRAHRTKTSDE